MTDPVSAHSEARTARIRAGLGRRHSAEKRFRAYGLAAILFSGVAVLLLIGDIIGKGWPAFLEHRVSLPITFDAVAVDPEKNGTPASLRAGDYQRLVREALRARFPDVTERLPRRKLEGLISTGAADDLRAMVLAEPALIGATRKLDLLLSDDADLYLKSKDARLVRRAGSEALSVSVSGKEVRLEAQGPAFASWLAGKPLSPEGKPLSPEDKPLSPEGMATFGTDAPSHIVQIGGGVIKLTEIGPKIAVGQVIRPFKVVERVEAKDWSAFTISTPETSRKITDAEIVWLEALRAEGLIARGFAWRFFANGDSREPELAGIRGALVGSALTLLVTLALCLPIGVGAAVYLEEFAPKNRFTDILEVNINNLAAVPSIVFGLLGLAMFLNLFGLPRSAPLVGGLVLALLVLPTIIIASRAALRAVPPSIKEAALGLGASHQQAIFHHVLPLAMPGIMTGTIIGMAHALGETAPLLMIGMVAFIVQVPQAVTDASTVLPVQIYLWSDLPEAAFQAKTAAVIMVLLAFLIIMNGLAILLRRRFERRW